MSRKHKSNVSVLAVLSLSLALLLTVSGCGKEEPGADQSSSGQMMGDAGSMMGMSHEEMGDIADAAALAGIEQKTCPVMEGNPINPNIFVEYQGQKVYFCCNACPAIFEADPEKYLAKLPQFQH